MTVCIAAICENTFIIGASDRMITAADIEFEPPKSKVVQLTSSIFLMTAGDLPLQDQITAQLKSIVLERVNREPENWWRVSDVAEEYARLYFREKQKRAENRWLAPLGLDHGTFALLSPKMDPKLVSDVVGEMVSYRMPAIATLITGLDHNGPHIYEFENIDPGDPAHNEQVQCYDGVGFCCIGMGKRHSDSEFMFDRHARTNPMPRTLLLTYFAKKRAEAAPGVGIETDIFFVGPALGFSYKFSEGEDIFKKLGKIYGSVQKKVRVAYGRANIQLEKYLKKLADRAAKQKQGPPPEPGTTKGPESPTTPIRDL